MTFLEAIFLVAIVVGLAWYIGAHKYIRAYVHTYVHTYVADIVKEVLDERIKP